MSEIGKKVLSAAQVVENSLAASLKDLESGIGVFLSGGDAKTNRPQEVQEQAPAPAREQESGSESTPGQIVANQDIGGKPFYLVQTQNPQGEQEHTLFEKGSTDYQVGKDITISWGNEGRPTGAKVDNGVELPWGGELAGKSQFSDQSQFSSSYHDNDQGL
jgi:hypothetical protein